MPLFCSGKLADVYALGVTLYTLICGRMPFTAETVSAVLEMHRSEPLTFPPGLVLDTGLKDLISRMMTKVRIQIFTSDARSFSKLFRKKGFEVVKGHSY